MYWSFFMHRSIASGGTVVILIFKSREKRRAISNYSFQGFPSR